MNDRSRYATLGTSCLVLTAMMGVTSLGCNRDDTGSRKPPPRGKVRLSPSELFSADMRRIGMHVAPINACVRIEYAGEGDQASARDLGSRSARK